MSNTKDLFLVVKRENLYIVLMVCLDNINDYGREDERVF